MAFIVRNTGRIRVATSGSGTSIPISTTVANFRALTAVLADGDTFPGAHFKGAEWCAGLFTYSAGVVTQTEVLEGSNGTSAVSFSSGNGELFIDAPSYWFDQLNLKEITVASATTCDIGAIHGAKIAVSGTTTITGFGTTANKLRYVRFTGALTLTHNGTSLKLLGAANWLTAAGDIICLVSDASGNWTELWRRPANAIAVDENAWSSFTPTVGVTGGSNPGSATASCRYRRLYGRTIIARVRVTLTTVAPAASPNQLTFTLPVNADTTVPSQTLFGRESGTTGKGIAGAVSSATVAFCAFADATSVFTGGNGTLVDLTIIYEASS